MTTVLEPASHAAPTVSRRTGRRIGYIVAILVNVAFAWILNVWPGWQEIPFLTPAAGDVVPLVNFSLTVAVVANLVYLFADGVRVKAFGEMVVGVVNLMVTAVLLEVFPFSFTGYWAGWEWMARFVLIIALIGTGISVVVNLVRLVRGPVART
jgi:hypothetical protein